MTTTMNQLPVERYADTSRHVLAQTHARTHTRCHVLLYNRLQYAYDSNPQHQIDGVSVQTDSNEELCDRRSATVRMVWWKAGATPEEWNITYCEPPTYVWLAADVPCQLVKIHHPQFLHGVAQCWQLKLSGPLSFLDVLHHGGFTRQTTKTLHHTVDAMVIPLESDT